MIPITQYAKVKDRYCLCYFGYSDEYLVLLRLIKPLLERRYPGLQLCLGCKDDKTHLLGNCRPILRMSQIKGERENYAYVREMGFDGISHPVEVLLSEANISEATICDQILPRNTNLCVVVTKGNYPTKDLTRKQTETISKSVQEQGYVVEVNAPVENASLVAGVESVGLFEAASRGIRTILMPTGFGLRLYKMLFPFGEVESRYL